MTTRDTIKAALPIRVRRAVRRCLRLNETLCAAGHARLMKMDLEGAESNALRGATEVLARLDYLAYGSWGSKDGAMDQVDALLKRPAFSVGQIDRNNTLACRQGAG